MEKKNNRSDGEPEAKRQKIDVNETTVVQEVQQDLLLVILYAAANYNDFWSQLSLNLYAPELPITD